MGGSRLQKFKNERLRQIMKDEVTTLEDVKQKQLTWYGHEPLTKKARRTNSQECLWYHTEHQYNVHRETEREKRERDQK